jgi:hypothetical protein
MESQHVAPEKVAQRTLGYGSKAYLVVFRYNVPTATLTLLWSEGKAHGIGWMPFLPRRKKKLRLIKPQVQCRNPIYVR